MKNKFKSDVQALMEKQEISELKKKIIEATNSIPKKIINEASYQGAISFKEHALDARKQAESKKVDLEKLRKAWQLISGYYA